MAPNDQVARAVLNYTWDSQRVQNVLHFRDGDGWITTELTTLGEDLVAWYDANMKVWVPPTLTLDDVQVTDLQPGGGVSVIVPANVTGTQPSAPLPNNVTAAVKLSTGLAGRSFRGRIYHVGLCENQINGNVIEATFLTALLEDYLKLLDVAVITQGELVVYSQFTGGAERTTGLPTPVIGMSINPTVDSQRRRLPERGR